MYMCVCIYVYVLYMVHKKIIIKEQKKIMHVFQDSSVVPVQKMNQWQICQN